MPPARTELTARSTAKRRRHRRGVNPDAVTVARAGAWSTLTGEALLSMSITEGSAAHGRVIARDVDKATVTKIEDAIPDPSQLMRQ